MNTLQSNFKAVIQKKRADARKQVEKERGYINEIKQILSYMDKLDFEFPESTRLTMFWNDLNVYMPYDRKLIDKLKLQLEALFLGSPYKVTESDTTSTNGWHKVIVEKSWMEPSIDFTFRADVPEAACKLIKIGTQKREIEEDVYEITCKEADESIWG